MLSHTCVTVLCPQAPVTPYREISPYIYHQLGDSESVVSCCEFLSYGTGGPSSTPSWMVAKLTGVACCVKAYYTRFSRVVRDKAG